MGHNAIGYNLFCYCENNVVNYLDLCGCLAASVIRIVNELSISALFASYASELYVAFSAAVAKISAYVSGILLPKISAIFWWQPWLIVGILASAVAIVIASVVAYRNIQLDKIKNSISTRIKTKEGKIDLNKFSKKPGSGPPRWIGPLGYELVKDLTEHKGPAYKLFRWGERVATIALDGKIIGK